MKPMEEKIIIALAGVIVALTNGGVLTLQLIARKEKKSSPERETIIAEKIIKAINGNGKSDSGMCLDHEKRLTTTETRQLNIIKGMDEWRTENAKAHDAIFNKLDAIVK